MRCGLSSALALLVVVGCGRFGVPADSAVPERAPDLEVEPSALDFGALAVLEEPERVDRVAVANIGDGDLHLLDLYLEPADAPFWWSVSEVLVAPGGSIELEVGYAPPGSSTDQARLWIESDDPEEPFVSLVLQGSGVAPVVELAPLEQDLGEVVVGCEQALELTLSNIGNADLLIESVEFTSSSDELVFDGLDDLGGEEPGLLILAPAEWVSLNGVYAPLDEYADTAWLTVRSDDPASPEVSAAITGTGTAQQLTQDSFELVEPEVDFLVALNKSGGMNQELSQVIVSLRELATALVEQGTDFRLAITQADDGCIAGDDLWIDRSFEASEAEAAADAMMALGGPYASNSERAFMLFEACLNQSEAGGCNEGLIRPGAALHLVGISDEPEQSENSWDHYTTLFLAWVDDPAQLVFHAVGGEYPSGCSGATAYTGMVEAVAATGGTFFGICSESWGDDLSRLAQGIADPPLQLRASAEPVMQTLEIRVDGVILEQGWSYDEGSWTVTFEPEARPAWGSTVELRYALAQACAV